MLHALWFLTMALGLPVGFMFGPMGLTAAGLGFTVDFDGSLAFLVFTVLLVVVMAVVVAAGVVSAFRDRS